MKRVIKKGVSVARQKAQAFQNDALEDLPEDASVDQLKAAAAHVSLAEFEHRVADAHDSWEADSLLEDLAKADGVEQHSSSDTCTPEEAARLRRELREQGPTIFCQRTLDCGRYTAKKLLTAFSIKTPVYLNGESEEYYASLLVIAIAKELSKRVKLEAYNTVEDAVDLLEKSKSIIVITGAGISTSLGIPDFRSEGSGLYSKLEHLGLSDPQEVFDVGVFKENPSIFYSVAKDIIPSTDRYTPTHKFIAMLHQRGKLLTNYSQNIDNLEVKAGLPRNKLVQCHGSFGTASCVRCRYQVRGELIFPDIRAGNIPKCPRCVQSPRAGAGSAKRKRSAGVDKRRNRRWSAADSSSDADDSDCDISSAGVMKPDITFFGEDLPGEFAKRLTEHDQDKVDLVVVIGTSLKVTPVSEIANWLPYKVPQIYVSRQSIDHINFDIDLLGDCDVVVAELCRRLGWPLQHEMIPPNQVINVTPQPGYKNRHVFKAAGPETNGV
ncbi:NAD-dependent histone deacetylase, silent information regulator Sir2 [Metarhizium rileyi]|uniref:NAD-dependent histone deacetylase, silent information regulator Sir2 n=1 Tax=Metarhizium rileyi (strain RCEF 4871) TaxID=1649241 RepID=A0A162M6L0_METRR|nr:NAD-dependent histone deacetylase, silent information regulator Sir2 [Metarhizium rileyi RCEF 4871]